MSDQAPHGLEMHWVEVRDERGAHMEARWASLEAAPAVRVETPAPHAA